MNKEHPVLGTMPDKISAKAFRDLLKSQASPFNELVDWPKLAQKEYEEALAKASPEPPSSYQEEYETSLDLNESQLATPEINASALNNQQGGDHYKRMKYQPIEFIAANDLDFLQGNIIKYACRHKFKNGIEDLEKVIHYAQLAIELQYEDGVYAK